MAKIFAEANFYGWNAIFLHIYCIQNRLNIWLQIICEKMQIFYIITIEIEYTIQFICMFFTFSFICMNVQNISKLMQNISKLLQNISNQVQNISKLMQNFCIILQMFCVCIQINRIQWLHLKNIITMCQNYDHLEKTRSKWIEINGNWR